MALSRLAKTPYAFYRRVMRKNSEQIERSTSLPGWMTGRPGQIAGVAAMLLLLACAGERRDYDANEGARTVAAGTDVYDDKGDLGTCGVTKKEETETPIGADVKVDGVGGLQDGQVMKYEFASGALALQDGETCEGSVWVHSQQAPAE
jgi:hypothetical protein